MLDRPLLHAIPPFATQLLATLPFPALLLNPAGVIQDANQAMADLLATQHDRLMRRSILELVEPTSLPTCEYLLQSACANPGAAQIGEIALLGDGGAPVLMRYNVLQLEATPELLIAIGQPLQEWLSLLQEVVALNAELALRNTELAHLNQQLRQAEQQREHVTNLLIHDIRSPLVATSASLEIVQRGITMVPPPSFIGEAISAGLKSLRGVVDLTNDLLDIKKLANGHQPEAIEPIALMPFLDDLHATLRMLLLQQQATMQLDVAPLDLAISGDRRLLRRVVLNILNNALRFTPRGGALAAEARPHGDGEVLLVLSDQGPGVAPEDRERIFLPFVQGSGESRRGSGLGLAFCREVVLAHAGRIWVEERPGGGSRFCITLPRAMAS